MICDCRSRHGLPPLAAALALLILAAPSRAHASRSCLDHVDGTPPEVLVLMHIGGALGLIMLACGAAAGVAGWIALGAPRTRRDISA